jgi:salicylate biosynthesis isochorismate synthase
MNGPFARVAAGSVLDVLARARERSIEINHPVLASFSVDMPDLDPLVYFLANQEYCDPSSLWIAADNTFAIAGIGRANEIVAEASNRFSSCSKVFHEIMGNVVTDGPEVPVWCGGFAFDERDGSSLWREFPSAALTLPEFSVVKREKRCSLVLNVLMKLDTDVSGVVDMLVKRVNETIANCESLEDEMNAVDNRCTFESALSSETWQSIVAAAIGMIKTRGAFQKVVLARQVQAHATYPISISAVMAKLAEKRSKAYLFGYKRGRSCFVGATPERLISLSGKVFRSTALAGSIRRGDSEDSDRALGEVLLNDAKNLHEHGVVVSTISTTLAPLAEKLSVASSPTLHRLPNIQHLSTPIEGSVKHGVDLLALVGALHPTPAVAGQGRTEAVAYIRAFEQLDRGWYAGPVGWMDQYGDGEFAVALRSALLTGTRAMLFAGCGIVSDSDPADEYRETGLKFRTMLDALGFDSKDVVTI